MEVKISTPKTNVQNALLTFHDVSIAESEIIMEALIMYKSKLDAEEFKDARCSCIEMFHQIDNEVITTRQQPINQ